MRPRWPVAGSVPQVRARMPGAAARMPGVADRRVLRTRPAAGWWPNPAGPLAEATRPGTEPAGSMPSAGVAVGHRSAEGCTAMVGAAQVLDRVALRVAPARARQDIPGPDRSAVVCRETCSAAVCFVRPQVCRPPGHPSACRSAPAVHATDCCRSGRNRAGRDTAGSSEHACQGIPDTG